MDIFLRNIDASLIAKIDDLAKEKKMSRNAYLKMRIESIAVLAEVEEVEDKYAALLQLLVGVVEDNNRLLKQVEDYMKRIDY